MDESKLAEINKLKADLKTLQSDIKAVHEQAAAAQRDSSKFFLFRGMYADLKEHFDSFKTAYRQMCDIYKAANMESVFPGDKDKAMEAQVKKHYFESVAVYQTVMNPLPSPPAPLPQGEQSTGSQLHAAGSESRFFRQCLPEIKIPTFDGEVKNWVFFRDTYLSLVHNSDVFTQMEKYHHLVSVVSGSAKAILKGIPFVEANYPQAWEALEKNYNNKRLLAVNYLKPLLDFKPLTGKPSLKCLKSFLSMAESITAFKMLQIPVAEDFILFLLGIRCLDPNTRREFERVNDNIEFPSFSALVEYLKREVRTMELSCDSQTEAQSAPTNCSKAKFTNKPSSYKISMLAQKPETPLNSSLPNSNQKGVKGKFFRKRFSCVVCNLGHSLYGCSKFRDANPMDKIDMLKAFRGCENCLSYDHVVKLCPSTKNCEFCHKKHHSWLHIHDEKPRLQHSSPPNQPLCNVAASSHDAHSSNVSNIGQVILGTAVFQIKDARGQYQLARAVLDCGSQVSFATNQFVKKLGLTPVPCVKSVSGVGQTTLHGLKGIIPCIIRPIGNSRVQLTTEAMVVSTITTDLPRHTVNTDFLSKCGSFRLADPNFWKRSQVDFLLGADLYYEILTGAPIALDANQPKLIPTVFGHVVAGKSQSNEGEAASSLFAVDDDLTHIMNRFWAVEEVKSKPLTSKEESLCELHFAETHYRLPTGRYVVSLPLKTMGLDLSSSKRLALSRFLNLEAKLRRHPVLRQKYCEFMTEYLELGHLKKATQPGRYFIPHHPVIKADDHGEMRIRVVFDASAVTSQGSLNDHLMVGPKLQLEIADILLNFRQFEVVFVTDIVKMFRQIMVASEDCAYQHIFWRADPTEVIEQYELTTVTYGLASSPYQSLRVIHQLVRDDGAAYPLASQVLLHQIYVDDILAGSHTLEGALALQQELIALLGKGCFQLSKWLSNRSELLTSLSCSQTTPQDLDLTLPDVVKILGMQYCPREDAYTYKVSQPPSTVTKRAILSAIARIYDPLGYLAPVVFLAKTILQDTWNAHCDWDQLVPESIAGCWQRFTRELPLISHVKVPRLLPLHRATEVEVLGFCDASTRGYAAAIFLRIVTPKNHVQVSLIKAKTKLAPTSPLTVPRLELNGALLLATLFESIGPFLNQFPISGHHWFSDSTVVLGWLKAEPNILKVYVAHRIVAINEILNISGWHHIRSEDNPADCASRGLDPSGIASHRLWWTGPEWLKLPPAQWPTLTNPTFTPQHGDPEIKQVCQSLLASNSPPFLKLIESFSSYYRLLRACSIFHRFGTWMKTHNVQNGLLSVDELQHAQTAIIRFIQAQHFASDKSLNHLTKSSARYLDPFIDDKGVVRVGGRLRHAPLSYQQKHPILLPGKCHFTRILIDHYHKSYLHVGPTNLQNLLRNQFWILSARNIIRQQLRKCLDCFRASPTSDIPKMGDLPASRFGVGQAFTNVGVDYGGPFLIKASLRRNAALSKAYLCLFVCLTTKAVHLELVSDGTTETFLAALDRFTSRRGKPSHIYSDNGRNFIGADRELKEVVAWLTEDQAQKKVHERLAIQGIRWSLNPPLSPHFGGIWEAGIKSAKGLLKKTVSQTPLTFEEMATIFIRIEAILNSRPLCPLNSDADSLDVLTPGHFLTGGPLVATPEIDLLDCKENVLSRWQLVKQKSQLCWKRWRNQYLSTLQLSNGQLPESWRSTQERMES